MNFFKLCRNQWDRTLAIVLVLGGLVALGIGWLAVSDTVFTFEQIPYLMSGGLLGVCLIALGCAAWMSADLRDEWRKLDRLEAAVETLGSSRREPVLVLPDPEDGPDPSGTPRAPGHADVASDNVRRRALKVSRGA